MGHKKSEIGQKTIAKQVEEYIDTHPIIRAALQHGIVNYSALAREIQQKSNLKNFEAVLIAIRRNAGRLIKLREHLETAVQTVLVESSLEIKTKIVVLTLSSDISTFEKLDELVPQLIKKQAKMHIIQGTQTVTFIVEHSFIRMVEEKIKKSILNKKENLVELIIKSPESIENVPGVAAMIMTALAERDINVVETLSCYTDTIVIIESKHLTEAIKVIEKLLKS